MDSQLVSERPSEAVGEKRASNGTDTAHRANGVKVTAKETDKLSPPSKNGSDGELDEDKNMGFAVYLKRHWHAVITYCAVFWSFGMCVAFLGPTLLDLGCMTSSDMKSISWVFFAQLLCSLLGASGAGYMVERWVYPCVCCNAIVAPNVVNNYQMISQIIHVHASYTRL